MAEIQTPLVKLDRDGEEVWQIDERHTLKDILRFVLAQTGGDRDEFLFLAAEVSRGA